jgi:hypothetical protein
MNIDLTQEIKEPNGSPIPLDGQPFATLGGVIYAALTRVQSESYEQAETCHDLATAIVGVDTYGFSTAELALVQARIKGLGLTLLRVPAFRMLEIKDKSEAKVAEPTASKTPG